MLTKTQTVSVVIPVYNEVERIHDCLAALVRQTVRPLEIIVVDNNSDDGTAAIARSFSSVTVIKEMQQGVVYARDRGFGAAQGDIIARIDADTIVDDDWVANVQRVFANTSVDLATGAVQLRGIAAAGLASRVDLFWRRYLSRRLGTKIGLQGANMALRRSVWQAVRIDVCHSKGLHEDFDLGLHSYERGYKALFAEDMTASVCHRQLNGGFRRFARYALTSPHTYLKHREWLGFHIYVVVAFVLVLYPVIAVLSRGYDEELERFSLRALFTAPSLRVNPATFLD